MTTQAISKAAIRKEARELLKTGLSKQDAYETLRERHKAPVIVASVLKNLPSANAIKRYKGWNLVLLSSLILTTLIFLYASFTIGIMLWYGLQIYVVARMLVKHYLWVTLFAGFAMAVFIYMAITGGSVEGVRLVVLTVTALLVLLTLVLSIWLKGKLCPDPLERKEPYMNPQGQKRFRVVHEFIEP